jgi:hypothetical protein
MRLFALPVRAKIRHDHAVARFGKQSNVAVFDPIGMAVGEIAMEQEERAAFSAAHFVHGEAGAVGRRKVRCV